MSKAQKMINKFIKNHPYDLRIIPNECALLHNKKIVESIEKLDEETYNKLFNAWNNAEDFLPILLMQYLKDIKIISFLSTDVDGAFDEEGERITVDNMWSYRDHPIIIDLDTAQVWDGEFESEDVNKKVMTFKIIS